MMSPEQIIGNAMLHKPRKVYVGFSGGRDSQMATDWTMKHVKGAEVFMINTGIGIERTRQYVRNTCAARGWPLTELRALEDCGQDYDDLVRRHGFPGPAGHFMMFARLKERAVRLLVRRAKVHRKDRIMLITGVRHDESVRRSRYSGREVKRDGAQLWVNPMYWVSKAERDAYLIEHALPINPVCDELGMSGECLCGAFAHPGELEEVRRVCPATAARIDRLYAEVKDRHPWGWEDRPPRAKLKYVDPDEDEEDVGPLCQTCEKSAIVQQALLELEDPSS